MSRPEFVYIAHGDGAAPAWKIGCTYNVVDRLGGLARFEPLTLVALFPGDHREEYRLHNRFAHLRATDLGRGREWYRDDGTLASPSAALSITTPNMVSGSMILPGVITFSTRGATRAWSANTLYYMPFLPLQAMTVTGLELEYVSTAGPTSSVARIGIYETGATLQPGNLVVDAGNVAIDSLGRRNVAGLSAALTAGQLYLFAFHPSAAVTTYQRTGTLITGPLMGGGGTAGQYYFWLSVSKTQAALATPGTAWNAPNNDNGQQMYYPVGISSWT